VEKKHSTLSFGEGLLVGTAAGINCWLFSYPQDIIKTMLQISEPGKYKPRPGMFDGGFYACGVDIYKKRGLKGFWVGIEPCLIRAAVANAIGIALY
jgi:solute carrier family 25 (mitochondrial carnitine/acylcarnitine transporter), member 20/29